VLFFSSRAPVESVAFAPKPNAKRVHGFMTPIIFFARQCESGETFYRLHTTGRILHMQSPPKIYMM
jgi:hypothetical protein